MSAPDDIATGETPVPLPDSRFCGTLTVLGETAHYCIAPDPEDAARGLRVFRWLPWAEDLRKVHRWREQGGERAHLVLVGWAERQEKIAAAERALREALTYYVNTCDVDDSDSSPVTIAAKNLRALGVDP